MSRMARASNQKRPQINIRSSEDLERAIEDIRRMTSPIPSVTEVIRTAIFEHRERMRRRTDKDKAA